MKFLLLAMLSTAVPTIAGPIVYAPPENGAMGISPDSRLLTRAPVCSRQLDTVVSDVVQAEGSGQSVAIYTAGASGGALSVSLSPSFNVRLCC